MTLNCRKRSFAKRERPWTDGETSAVRLQGRLASSTASPRRQYRTVAFVHPVARRSLIGESATWGVFNGFLRSRHTLKRQADTQGELSDGLLTLPAGGVIRV